MQRASSRYVCSLPKAKPITFIQKYVIIKQVYERRNKISVFHFCRSKQIFGGTTSALYDEYYIISRESDM